MNLKQIFEVYRIWVNSGKNVVPGYYCFSKSPKTEFDFFEILNSKQIPNLQQGQAS